jgi:hypothetical protein
LERKLEFTLNNFRINELQDNSKGYETTHKLVKRQEIFFFVDNLRVHHGKIVKEGLSKD